MTASEFVRNGQSEGTKGAFHWAMLGLAAICCTYNAVAYSVRHERHLLNNSAIYAAIMGLEIYQVARHIRKSETP